MRCSVSRTLERLTRRGYGVTAIDVSKIAALGRRDLLQPDFYGQVRPKWSMRSQTG